MRMGPLTLDCAEVVRTGDFEGVRPPSAQGDSSIDLDGSLNMGRLGESPVNLSMVPEGCSAREALKSVSGKPRAWVKGLGFLRIERWKREVELLPDACF